MTRDTCFPGGGTHITRDICFPGGGTHITRDTCFQLGEHISLGIRFSQVGEHISLGIRVSQVVEHMSLLVGAYYLNYLIIIGIVLITMLYMLFDMHTDIGQEIQPPSLHFWLCTIMEGNLSVLRLFHCPCLYFINIVFLFLRQ